MSWQVVNNIAELRKMTGELRRHHLKKTWDFQRILRGRQQIHNENLMIFYGKNPTQENYRFGISIPQKVVKKAVLRNKYKRQIKHVLLDLQREGKGRQSNFKGWDFLIIIRKTFITKNFDGKKRSLESLLNFFNRKVANKPSATSKNNLK